MKTSLWVVVVLVTGIVGFLIGYSVSAYTGTRSIAGGGAEQAGAPHSQQPAGHAAEAGGYGGGPTVPTTASGGGYR